MKKLLLLSVVFISLVSCQDVVELDLNNADPRLVIDARVELYEDGTTTSTVFLTRTADFYTEENPFVEDAEIKITASDGTEHFFIDRGFGNYSNETLQVVDDLDYTLSIIDQGNTYTATESLVRTAPLLEIQQETITGFDDDIVELTAFYNDPAGLGDYYLFGYIDELNEQIDVRDDEFFDGNRAPTIFFLEESEVGSEAIFSIKGIDRQCFEFYLKLLQQSGEGDGGPFDAPPATVRGNIVNETDENRFPFGYFRISEVFELEYTIQELD
ncbi:MAG: DUF4249 domain-containing protein [Nonlabens sp.]